LYTLGDDTGLVCVEDPDLAARDLIRQIDRLAPEDSGTFIGPDGRQLSW
jgi:hypothetical protein